MRRRTGLCAAVLLYVLAGTARAEILEIKGEGFVNGEITAEDDATVTFKDGRGVVRKIPKSSVLMREEEKKVSVIERIKDKTAEAVKKVSSPLKNVHVPSMAPNAAAPAASSPAPRPLTAHQADVDAATGLATQATDQMRSAYNAQLEQQRKMRRMTQIEQAGKAADSVSKSRFTSLDDDAK